MSDEDTGNDGSIEAAVAQLQEARAEAATPEPKKQPEAPEPAAPVAPGEQTDQSPPEQPEAADADPVEAEADAGPEPTIDAPVSFTPEEKEMFKALPPEQQQSVLRLAKGAQAAESRRQNEHQAAVREAQAIAEQAAQERQQLQSALRHYKLPMVAAYEKEFSDVVRGEVDMFRLAQDPNRWSRYQAYQNEFQRLAYAERQINEQAERDENTRLTQHIESRNSELIEARPELKDPVKFRQFDEEISSYLLSEGAPEEAIQKISLMQLRIAEKAMKWDKAQKAKAQVPKPAPTPDGKVAIQSHIRSVPVLKPGMGRSAGGVDDKIAAIDQRARNSGSVDDAAARIRLRLGRRA